MHKLFLRNFKKRFQRQYKDIDPEDIFLDSANLPGFAEHRFEGRIEKPIAESTFFFLKCILGIVICLFFVKLWTLQINKGSAYAEVSENNRLAHTLIFANRGLIYDRNKVELATNAVKDDASGFAARIYPNILG
ncbi:MAG: hypothetical protein V4465_02960, partial [Patescibacteria group bacterium]